MTRILIPPSGPHSGVVVDETPRDWTVFNMVETRSRVAVLLLAVVLGGLALYSRGVGVAPVSEVGSTVTTTIPTETPATGSTTECSSDTTPGTETWIKCQADRFVMLAESDGMVEALNALQREGKQNPGLLEWCHSIDHELGRWAFRDSQDLVAALKYDDRACQFGYLHGAFEEFAGKATDEEMRSTLPIVCNDRKVDVSTPGKERDWAECLHAIGHAAAVHTPKDILKSLEWCRLAGEGEVISTTCSGGVFMEYGNSYIRAKSGGTSFDPSAHGPGNSFIDDGLAQKLCHEVPGDFEGECWRRIGNFWGPAGVEETSMLKMCEEQAGSFMNKCGYAVGAWVMRDAYSKASGQEGVAKYIASVCNTNDRLDGDCFGGAVYPIRSNEVWSNFSTTSWMKLCEKAERKEAQQSCREAELRALLAVPDPAARDAVVKERGFTEKDVEAVRNKAAT